MNGATNALDLDALRQRRGEILERAALRGASNVRVFGSIVRGERRSHSDIDLLVEMDGGRSLIDLVGLGQELEDLLGVPVDVLSAAGISAHLRQRIVGEAVAL